MHSSESFESESVSLTRGIEIWVSQGHLSLLLGSANFGGVLALLYEASRLAKASGIQKILFFSGKKLTWLTSLSNRFEQSAVQEWPSYPTHIDGLGDYSPHSTLRLAKEATLVGVVDTPSVWNSDIVHEVNRFIEAEEHRSPILFATKFSVNNPELGDFCRENWTQVLKRLAISRPIMVLGSDPDRQAFSGLEVIFLDDHLTFAAQIELASRNTFPLIGDASGFFSAAIWQSRPYLCFKDLDYDAHEMREEHNGVDKLKVACPHQLLIRSAPKSAIIDLFLREAGYARA